MGHSHCILDAHKIANDSKKHVTEFEFCRNRIWMVVVQIYHVSQVIPGNVGFNIMSQSRCSCISPYTMHVPATEIARAL